mmetsp:Transcript_19299/g.57328  ORF Transcript_19299/g.57328 Transcript_19299/m.57328 type:complete len:174 (+) Transcript_19299:1419-1940(+)
MRTDKRKVLWRRLVESSRYANDGSTIDQMALNCCCGNCRDLLYEAMDELRDVIKQLDLLYAAACADDPSLPPLPAGLLDQLVRRSEDLERFLAHDYARKLELQSPDMRLCARAALTTVSNPWFKCECTHARADGTVGEVSITFDEHVLQTQGRASTPDNWNDDCTLCQKEAII